MFKPEMLDGMEWQQVVSQSTPAGTYRVEVTWALDHYRITVIRDERVIKRVKAWYIRTAVSKANRLLKQY